MFPVETHYLNKTTRQTISTDACHAVRRALHETKQSILVFLPGEAEIRRTEEMLNSAGLPSNIIVRPLYGAMGFVEQDAALNPAPEGMRKIVLATTIAETSLTIEGIGTVIDTGFKRSPRFDPASGMTALETVRVSLASADQRRGRAGRLGPGVCYRLWPEAETRALAAHDQPEVLVSDLAPLALELAAWGVNDAASLSWLDAPPAAAFAQARDLLRKLEAIDEGITAMGKAMVRVPLHPRLAHMVVKGNELGSGETAAQLAAFLSERDGQGRDAGCNIASRLAAMRENARVRIQASAKQIRQILSIRDVTTSLSEGVLAAFAWPDRIGQKRGGERRYRLSGGGGAILPEHDGLAKNEFLAVATTDGASGDQKIFLAAAITREDLETHFAKLIEVSEDVQWDTRSQSVNAARVRKLGALILEERVLTDANPEAMAAAMTHGLREMGLRVLPWSEGANSFRAQVMFLQRLLPEDGWPDLSDGALTGSLETWLTPYLSGISRKSHLERLDMFAIIKALVPYELQRQMDVLAPRRIEVPSGSHIAIDYETEGDPLLRVRLQEMFGLAKTPSIARGRAQLRIELLSPAGRPVAVTKSLETFWTNGYPDVRADMRGRYPKHSWPEDPMTAAAVAPRRRR
jgi:ATP-dependent helicase HrpB